ncbi:MAG: VOC family protein [Bacteroidia bacterium]|nr:VOC family protein [Bacteroidia bacterium]
MQYGPIIPILRYDDSKAAVEWLCRAFGFERHQVFEDEAGRVIHAELRFGNSMIMLGTTANETDFGKHLKQPREVGGHQTQCPFVMVADPEAHYARAAAEGARIVFELKSDESSGRSYSCHDPEGFLWSFGDYNPWTAAAG